MSNLLAEYDDRIRKRESLLKGEPSAHQKTKINPLKFSASGKIKPFHGLTCITWVDEKSELHAKLSAVQHSLRTEF